MYISIHTYVLEHCHLLVGAAEGPHIIDGETSVLGHQGAVQLTIGHLRNSLECAVIGRLEVDRCGPVVAKVLNHLARSALRCRGRIK